MKALVSKDWNVVPRPQLCADSSLLRICLSTLFSDSLSSCSFFLSLLSLASSWHMFPSPFPALSLDEIIRFLMRETTFSLQRVINSDLTNKRFETMLRMRYLRQFHGETNEWQRVHSSTRMYVSPNSHVAGDYDKLHRLPKNNAPRRIMRACVQSACRDRIVGWVCTHGVLYAC